jgi:hypothetical protein
MDEPIDLAVLDPCGNPAQFDATVSRIAQRAIELRRFRRAVVRRGMLALGLAMAAGVALWFAAPKRQTAREPDLLDWATRDIGAADVLGLGGEHAQ